MTKFRHTSQYKDFVYSDLRNNKFLYHKTEAAVTQRTAAPRFIYTHLMMPHFPYYVDANGKPNTMEQLDARHLGDKMLYLRYLQYTTKEIIQLVSYILANSAKPPVILLLSDHGYRYLRGADAEVSSNLAAIYLPEKNYKNYQPSVSNVNQFRILFNTLFHQALPLLPDKWGE